jgi:hypothetical protein
MELGCCSTTKERCEGEDEMGVAWAPAAANNGKQRQQARQAAAHGIECESASKPLVNFGVLNDNLIK